MSLERKSGIRYFSFCSSVPYSSRSVEAMWVTVVCEETDQSMESSWRGYGNWGAQI